MENKDKHGLAINILKFQYFNFEFFNCQEIVLYETLMVLGGKSFTKRDEFFHSTKTLADKTGIKRHSVDRILIKFKKMGIIDYQIKGMPKVKHIRILWKNILEMLPKIYQFDKVEEYFGGSTQPLIDFYQLLAENNEKIAENTEEKNSIKNSTEEYKKELKKEIIDNALAEEEEIAVNINKLKDFINNVEYYGHGKEYNESDLIGALRVYDIENIMDMISYNAENNPFFDLKKLLRMTKKNKITAMENFIVEKKQQIEILCDRFQSTLTGRIRYFNERNDRWKNQYSIKFDTQHKIKIWQVFKLFEKEEVFNAFTAFCDDIINQQIEIKKEILNYFLKQENNEYPIIEKYRLKYLNSYFNFD